MVAQVVEINCGNTWMIMMMVTMMMMMMMMMMIERQLLEICPCGSDEIKMEIKL